MCHAKKFIARTFYLGGKQRGIRGMLINMQFLILFPETYKALYALQNKRQFLVEAM